MSKYKVIETEFRNLETLCQVLDEMGVVYEKAPVPTEPSISMIGYHGDTRPEKGSIVIRRAYVNKHWSGGVSNDIGFAWNGQAYGLIISEYDSGVQKTNQAVNQMKQTYQAKEFASQAIRRGLNVDTQERLPDGSIRLVLRKRM